MWNTFVKCQENIYSPLSFKTPASSFMTKFILVLRAGCISPCDEAGWISPDSFLHVTEPDTSISTCDGTESSSHRFITSPEWELVSSSLNNTTSRRIAESSDDSSSRQLRGLLGKNHRFKKPDCAETLQSANWAFLTFSRQPVLRIIAVLHNNSS